MINISKIFIAYYNKLIERRKYTETQFLLANIPLSSLEWITSYDIDEWNLNEIMEKYPHLFDASGIHCKLIRNFLNYPEISFKTLRDNAENCK